MIEEVITRTLILVLGFAYPAFQCFKTVERNRVEIHELRFWCQYWITVAVITVLEQIGDVAISWVPMYGEMKLALFIYLWYPRSKGTGKIYESFLRPCVLRHETSIDRSLIEFRERAWNLAVYYWHNCSELGSTTILQFLQYVSSQSAKFTGSFAQLQQDEGDDQSRDESPGSPPARTSSGGLLKLLRGGEKRRQPSGSSPKSEAIKVQLQNQTKLVDALVTDAEVESKLKDKLRADSDLQKAKLRLRRFIEGQ